MDAPPPYPRIPHLLPGRGTADDLNAPSTFVADLLAGELVVEEKLDGANVVVWPAGHGFHCALRSGVGAVDRAGQLGPLRAWVAEHTDALRSLLGRSSALYAEWLLVTHTVVYDRLPAYLVALDLWSEDNGFATVGARDARCAAAGVATPPELWRGHARSVGEIEARLGRSAFGDGPAEGLVVRRMDGAEPRVAKLLRAGFNRLGDDDWRAGRPRNRLREGAPTWH